jgi:hypothetical protein
MPPSVDQDYGLTSLLGDRIAVGVIDGAIRFDE